MTLQLFEASDEDSFVAIAQHVAELLNEGQARTALADTPANRFVNDCTNLVQEQRYEEYVTRMAAQVGAIFSKMSEKEAECCASILVHAVGRVPEGRQQAAASALAAALVQSEERAEERMNALLALYGIVAAQPAAQRAVLLAAAAYAAKSSGKCRSAFCAAVRGKASRWVAEWKLAPVDARQLYLALAAATRGAADRPTNREHLSLAGSALSLAVPGSSPSAPELAEAAAGALAEYLRSGAIYTLDLLPLPAVAALAAHAKYGPLHKLVAAVLAGDVAGTRAASTPAALEAAGSGVTAEAVLSKARMTALLSACAAAGHGEVALAELQKALDVSDTAAVQSWVVKAIGTKLVEGRVDSVRGVLSVARSTHPSFGGPQWKKLGAQIAALKDTVGAAVAAMSAVKPPPHVSARGVAAAVAAR
ncbi:hypothetical protein CHLRE_09g417200v5 [Chlamydomonas reinhardtii]|uniref:Uncharacterized protein n=1 Tax=Chlamydomonas reinhardtii TaxID=3055 RepID=A8J538_CHLRE|nr:uncharacterized protein CHLRE_09g417200v5 [Chlamydomonas reinhardtii]PNW79493.1 hypothetical protein CHLRE_09g417200v5 [Chlamydomonas reinhardtii]|eukprot:XP_001696843.1 predicted protein [Chlamydomonas reinhardtii]